jgi:hypothetical protein
MARSAGQTGHSTSNCQPAAHEILVQDAPFALLTSVTLPIIVLPVQIAFLVLCPLDVSLREE